MLYDLLHGLIDAAGVTKVQVVINEGSVVLPWSFPGFLEILQCLVLFVLLEFVELLQEDVQFIVHGKGLDCSSRLLPQLFDDLLVLMNGLRTKRLLHGGIGEEGIESVFLLRDEEVYLRLSALGAINFLHLVQVTLFAFRDALQGAQLRQDLRQILNEFQVGPQVDSFLVVVVEDHACCHSEVLLNFLHLFLRIACVPHHLLSDLVECFGEVQPRHG